MGNEGFVVLRFTVNRSPRCYIVSLFCPSWSLHIRVSELLRKLRHFEIFARAGGIYFDISPEKIMVVLLIFSWLDYAICSKKMS